MGESFAHGRREIAALGSLKPRRRPQYGLRALGCDSLQLGADVMAMTASGWRKPSHHLPEPQGVGWLTRLHHNMKEALGDHTDL
jgi:hypothetical protein